MPFKEEPIPVKQIVPDMSLGPLFKTPTQERINLYAKMSGDYNPIHVDTGYARKAAFDGTIAHGTLLLSYISEMMLSAFGTQWFATGWLSVRFRSPAPSGKQVKVEGKIRSVEHLDKQIKVICDVTCRDEDDIPIITSEAGLTIETASN